MTAPYLFKKCLKISKEVIRSRKSTITMSKKKNDKRTNNDPQNITQKTKDREK